MNDHDRDTHERRQDAADAFDDAAPQPGLALDEDERLPWLESADEDDDEGGADSARLVRFALFGLALIALVAGGLWLVGRNSGGPVVAEGGVIKAPPRPYKEAPAKDGGKTFAGTGDSAAITIA